MLDEAVAADSSLEMVIAQPKFELARELKDEPRALEYGRRLVEGPFKHDAEALKNLAWSIVDPVSKSKPTPCGLGSYCGEARRPAR